MRIEAVPITHPDATRLVAEVQEFYVSRYGSPDDSPVDAAEFDPPAGRFFVGYDDAGVPVATGAWRRSRIPALGAGRTAEIKRMFVVPTHQRRGLARAMLARLEQTAAAAGVEALVLETGTLQPEAIALYVSAGYEQVPGFGHYRGSPLSRCFARRLPAPEAATEWDAEAESFDEEPDHGLRDPVTREAWRDLLHEVLPAAPARVADLGCGTGTLVALLAEGGYAVTGVDVSPRMLEVAGAKTSAAHGVELLLGDAADPPLEPAYDVVLCRHVLWALPDPVAALRRWAALLAPGGRLVLVEGRWGTGAGLTADRAVGLLDRAGLSARVRRLTDPVLWGRAVTDERYLVVASPG